MKKLEISLTDKNYADALARWCSEVIEAHLASHRLEHLPKLDPEKQLLRDSMIGWRGGQEVKARSSRGVRGLIAKA